jgi:hypothetical protein
MAKPVFTNWDGRPAIVMSDASEAVAIIEPGGDWEEVDALDVLSTAPVISSADAFRRIFSRRFGSFSIPTRFAKD